MSSRNYAQRFIERRLTSAEILALGATPIEIIAAPGAGKAIEIINATFCNIVGEDPYVYVADLVLRAATAVKVGETFVEAVSDRIEVIRPNGSEVLTVNEAVSLSTAGAPTGGDGEILVKVWYAIHVLDGDDEPVSSPGNPYSKKTV